MSFPFPKGSSAELLRELDWLERKENLLLMGAVGTGKTHMATAPVHFQISVCILTLSHSIISPLRNLTLESIKEATPFDPRPQTTELYRHAHCVIITVFVFRMCFASRKCSVLQPKLPKHLPVV
ncbi:ATP-binding protein [Brevibacillus borstelensis]|uniref:ATP-binding protein n=1 Tax=Brevibacillus borstelensis TaxID=45462 RepID=UPI0030C3F2F9